MQHKKYRLRWNKEIVGFAQETAEGVLYKGKEWLWFMRGKPRYNQIDEGVGIQDRMHRDIYELDIVQYALGSIHSRGLAVVLWHEYSEEFILYDFEKKEQIPLFVKDLFLFENEKLEIISHLFNQTEIERKIPFRKR